MTQPQEKQVSMSEVMDDFDRFEYFFQNRWQLLIYLCIATVILVGVASWGVSAHRTAQARAASALGTADSPEKLREALAAHGNHPAAGVARLRLVSLLFDAGKTDEALTEARALIASKPAAPEVNWQARLNEGYILETLGRGEEAADAFATLGLEIEVPEFIRDEANVNAARIFLVAAKPERAKGCLQAINTAKGYTEAGAFWVEQAKMLLKRIP
jgi:hypothetical protein